MKINIATVMKNDGASLPFGGSVDLGVVEFCGSTLEFKEPPTVSGIIQNLGGTIEITGEVSGSYVTQCSRCVQACTVALSAELDERVEDDFSDADGECLSLKGNILDISGAVEAAIFGAIDTQPLCDEACKGLCPVCGANLNESECNCDTTVYDPRFAIFRKLMQRGEENGSSEEKDIQSKKK